jgi:hypothetical protein
VFRAIDLPPGLSLGFSPGVISGTINSGANTTTPYAVTVTASDGTSSGSQKFSWTVATLVLVSPGDQTNLDGDSVSFALGTHYHGTSSLSFTSTGLPPGLSLNSTTGALSGTVSNTADTNSPYSVTVTATAGSSSASQTFHWNVNPRITIADLTDQANAAGDTVSLSVSATDASGGTLSYSVSGLPSGLSINSGSGAITGTIATGADTSSPYTVTVTAADAHASTTATFHWTVVHVALANPGDQINIDGDTVALTLHGHDADGDTVSYSASGLPSGLSVNTNTGAISGTLSTSADQNSPYLVTVTAADSSHSTSQHFLWNVYQVGVTNPGDQSNTEGNVISLSVAAHGIGGTLTYSEGGLPAGLTLNTSTGLISGTLAAGTADMSPYPVTVAVSNGSASSNQSFTWNVSPRVVLTPPSSQGSVEGHSASLQVTASDTANATLTYSAYTLPPGLSISSSSGLISGTVSSGASSGGPYGVVVTASDGTYSSSDSFTWTVTPTTNTPPTLTNPGTQTNATGDLVALPLSASGTAGDALTFSATGLPDGLSIDSTGGIITGILATDAASTTPYSVTVTVDDGNGGSASQTFSWIVNDTALTVQGISLSATEGIDTGEVTVATFTTADLGAQASDFTATVAWGDGLIDVGTIDGGSGSFTVSDGHAYAEKGSYTISVDVTASGGSTGSATSTATVADATLTLTGDYGLGVLHQQANTLTLASFTDANPMAPSSDFSATINWGDGSSTVSGNISYSPATLSSISGTHSYSQDGSYTVTVTLTDVDGATATTTSTVYVGDIYAGVPATLGVTSFVDADSTGSASDFTATINWGDGTSTSGVQATGSGGIYTLQAVTHIYAGDSVSQSSGTYTVTVTITDDGGSTLATSGTVAVVRPPLTLFVGNTQTPPGSLSLSGAEVAAFTVPDTSDNSSEFAATINWGDGTTSSGTVTGGGGLFHVLGSHTYDYDGEYVIQVDVSQHWDTLLTAARGAGLVLAQVARPTIQGPHVVLGVAEERVGDRYRVAPVSKTSFEYRVAIPEDDPIHPEINFQSIQWTFEKIVNGQTVPSTDAIQVRKSLLPTAIFGYIRFKNTPAHIELGLTYKRRGDNTVHTVGPFPISIVQLSVQKMELKKVDRFGPTISLAGGIPSVKIDTRPIGGDGKPINYSYANLKNPKTADAELAKGLVSFKATVMLRGAGPNKREGVPAIHLGWLQTIVGVNFKVTYKQDSAQYQPMKGGNPLQGPWLDSSRPLRPPKAAVGTGGDSSFTRSSDEQEGENLPGGGQTRVVVGLDAPSAGFRVLNPETMPNSPWRTSEGGFSFVNHLTAYSTDAPFLYTVIAAVPWSVTFVGSNADDATNEWKKKDMETKVNFSSDRYAATLPAFGAALDTFTSTGPTFAEATNGNELVYKG